MRHLTSFDLFLGKIDQALAIATGNKATAHRNNPASTLAEPQLSSTENKQSIAIMRINHAGEMAAQGLYQGQALTASNQKMVHHMQTAANEEIDHLAWCEERLEELDGRTSYLDPLWFLGAVLIGMSAGVAGDAWSLGFIAETERQVSQHLQNQRLLLPTQDTKSARILEKMEDDEDQHAANALAAGGKELPSVIKLLMHLSAKVMVKTSYYL